MAAIPYKSPCLAAGRPVLEELAERVHRRGIRLGVICIGDGKELRNEAWINQAVQRCRAIVADPKIKADALIVQSWYQAPTKILPETDPGAPHRPAAISSQG